MVALKWWSGWTSFTALRAFLEHGHAPEIGAPHHEGFLEQTACFQIFDEGGTRVGATPLYRAHARGSFCGSS
jgi:hypothetical protein